MANIGFLGLGNMGGPMAINLCRKGYSLKVFDLNKQAMTLLASEGAKMVHSAVEAVDQVDYVISMLPNSTIVEALYLEKDKLLENIQPKTLVMDCSTISAASARKVIAAAAERNIQMIDAPVSGGTGGAKAGTLTFMCGGDVKIIEQVKPILLAMGKNVFHAGTSGAGQLAKICNNLLLAIHMVGTAEALALGVNNGLDPKVLSDIMLQSSGRNWSLELYNPYPGVMENVPASRDYQGGFMVDLMRKDLTLALETALTSQSPTPMGGLAKSLYDVLKQEGKGALDFSVIQSLFQ